MTADRVWLVARWGLTACVGLIGTALWVRHCNNQAVLNHAGADDD
jgi:hypothetical protein